jgi:hypothetical protein
MGSSGAGGADNAMTALQSGNPRATLPIAGQGTPNNSFGADRPQAQAPDQLRNQLAMMMRGSGGMPNGPNVALPPTGTPNAAIPL